MSVQAVVRQRLPGALAAAALALAAVLLAALVATARATAAGGYWAAGYHRLFFAGAWTRFDGWAAPAALAAAALGLAVAPRFRFLPGARLPVALLVLTLLPRGLGALDAWHAARGPNVVLISVDTLRADHLGAYGHTPPTSPTVDHRLAAAGVVFEQVYSQSPKTTPSHMTLLTSLFPSVHGIELWEEGRPGHVLNPAVFTLAEVLKEAGYATGAFTGGAHMDRRRGFDQGFDVYTQEGELGHALAWLKRHHRRKFFLFFHTYQVHDPYVPPRRYIDLFDPDYRGPILDAVARVRRDPGAWDDEHRLFWASVDRSDPRAVRFVSNLYDAGIRHMDEETLARLLGQLDAYGLGRDTLVVFTSDHGEAFGEHGAFLHDDLYAGTLHVPLVLRWPARLPAGVRVAARARTIDVMPTILDLLGIPAPPDVQGRSLVPLLAGSGADADAVSEYSQPQRPFESLRRGERSYIRDGASEHVFADGPREEDDVAAREPDTIAAMRAELDGWRAACRGLAARYGPRGEGVMPGRETLERLRALGYVQ